MSRNRATGFQPGGLADRSRPGCLHPNMYILGINAYHGDAAAAIIKDGELSRRLKRSDSIA